MQLEPQNEINLVETNCPHFACFAAFSLGSRLEEAELASVKLRNRHGSLREMHTGEITFS